MRSRLMALAGVSAVVLAVGTVRAPAVSASPGDCRGGWFCVWEHYNYEGSFVTTNQSLSYVGNGFNDKATSYWNRTSWYVTLYPDAGYRGGCMMNSIPPGGSSPLLPAHLNDKLSSYTITPHAIC
ncbi:peptidase inhibitor family I36 protein [Streptomyces sp. NPDC094448]|uniref:peptidase inhibitor family I36 protein n=1 Tax=Streptomyces sp. NPDC094448 TaxID=3366063 RepID=UPI0037F988C9